MNSELLKRQPKLCVNCKYYHRNLDDTNIKWEYRKHSCSYYTFNRSIDLVTGQQYYGAFKFCNDMRVNDCGPDGKYYVEKDN